MSNNLQCCQLAQLNALRYGHALRKGRSFKLFDRVLHSFQSLYFRILKMLLTVYIELSTKNELFCKLTKSSMTLASIKKVPSL